MHILKHGILGETGFTYMSSETGSMQWCATGDTIHAMKHIGDIYELAISCKLERIWIHTSLSTFEALSDTFVEDAQDTYNTGDKGLDTYAYFEVYKKQASYSQAVGIHFCSHLYSKWRIRHPLDGQCLEKGIVVTDKELYIAIAYLETLLGIPLTYSTGYVGQELIRQTNTGRKANNLLPCEADLSLFIRTTGASRPFHRTLSEDEEAMLWFHMIDKNANFLSCSHIQLGIGNYERVLQPHFNKNDIGLWHVSIEGTSQYEGVYMPSAATLLYHRNKTGWLYTSTVQLLQDIGYHLTFHEALVWPKPQRTALLDEWCKLLSHAYTELRTNFTRYKNEAARNLAKEMLKGMYVKGLSWLTMDIEEGRGNYIDRPHWYHLVIAEAYQRMIRNVITFEKLGVKPVLMNNDALIYASHEKDITKALPGLRMEQKPGHYKHVWCLPLAECNHLFTPENSTGKILLELKGIAKRYGYYM